MSTLDIHRLIVRLNHDTEMANLLRTNPSAVWSGLDLSEIEREWLRKINPDTFFNNENNCRQTLEAIVKTIDIPAALAVNSCGDQVLFDFFSHPFFHRAVQNNRSLTSAFCDYLIAINREGILPDRRITPLAKLFKEMSRVMFYQNPISCVEAQTITVASTIGMIWCPKGIIELIISVRAYLGQEKNIWKLTVNELDEILSKFDLDNESSTPVLIESSLKESRLINLSCITATTASLLEFASGGCSLESLTHYAHKIGLGSSLGRKFIEQLVKDGLLVFNE